MFCVLVNRLLFTTWISVAPSFQATGLGTFCKQKKCQILLACTEIRHFWRNCWWFKFYLILTFHHVDSYWGHSWWLWIVSFKLVPHNILDIFKAISVALHEFWNCNVKITWFCSIYLYEWWNLMNFWIEIEDTWCPNKF